MKPTNLPSKSCDPVSSNCVVWQGPDIECLNLCNGDSVSEVVNKMATELCDIMKALNVSSYDLSCFNLKSCPPETFQQLLQFIMERICKLEGCTGCTPDCNGVSNLPSGPQVSPGCPECEVNIASCFTFTNQLGDVITSMQLTDYVHAIGNKICGIIDGTVTINETLANHTSRIVVLENKPEPSIQLPSIIPACVLEQSSTTIDVVLQALESQFCELRGSLGGPNDIYQSLDKQPAGLSQEKSLGSAGTMGSLPGWNTTVVNLSQSLTNIWLAIGDMRKAVRNIQLNCCPVACDGVSLNLTSFAVDTNNIKLYITGSISSGFLPCNGNTLFTISDTLGNSYQYPVDIPVYLNNPVGIGINLTGTPVNGNSNLTIIASPCFSNNEINATCQSVLQSFIQNQSNCPVLVSTPGLTSISYSIATTTANTTYKIELWNVTNSELLQVFTHNVISPSSISGSFTGLTGGTAYNLRVKVIAGSTESTCPFNSQSTLPVLCPEPDNVTSNLEY